MAEITFDEMRRFLIAGWGELGRRTAEAWLDFNKLHFEGKLEPLPIFFTNTTPFGKRLAHCRGNEVSRHIALNMPVRHAGLVADRATLLHEMVHQALHERNVNAKHAGAEWREEIMRLHYQITGTRLWAGGTLIRKLRQPDGSRKSVRIQKPCPDHGAVSLTQLQIARWPHDLPGFGPL